MTSILLDTGVIVALLDRDERYHRACMDVIEDLASPLVTCEAVITESCYLLRNVAGAPEAVVENVIRGRFQMPFRLARSAPEILKILRKYRDRQVNFADACLVHMATELRTGAILTLDRDFEVYRWAGNRPFEPLIHLLS